MVVLNFGSEFGWLLPDDPGGDEAIVLVDLGVSKCYRGQCRMNITATYSAARR